MGYAVAYEWQEARMRMDQITAEGIAIPMELIRTWRDRKAELDQIIADAQREGADISRKLDAVAILAPELGNPFSLTAPEIDEESVSVISELAKVVVERNALLPPKALKKALREREGVPKFADNYFYTALKRAVEKRLIRKVGDLYGPLATSSPQGENPGA